MKGREVHKCTILYALQNIKNKAAKSFIDNFKWFEFCNSLFLFAHRTNGL